MHVQSRAITLPQVDNLLIAGSSVVKISVDRGRSRSGGIVMFESGFESFPLLPLPLLLYPTVLCFEGEGFHIGKKQFLDERGQKINDGR